MKQKGRKKGHNGKEGRSSLFAKSTAELKREEGEKMAQQSKKLTRCVVCASA